MEIVKRNCNYTITDTHEGWNLTGDVTKDVDGRININLRVSSTGELTSEVGTYYYAKDGNMIYANFSVSEASKEAFLTYADSIVNQVLTSIPE